MADVFDKETRSRIMSSIRSKDTKPELMLRKGIFSCGYRYRLHYGGCNSDIAFPRHKVAVFVDGDFWHGYNWLKRGKVPPKKYWQPKIKRNIERDKKYNKQLKKQGWKVLRFWEFQVKQDPKKCALRVTKELEARNDNFQ